MWYNKYRRKQIILPPSRIKKEGKDEEKKFVVRKPESIPKVAATFPNGIFRRA